MKCSSIPKIILWTFISALEASKSCSTATEFNMLHEGTESYGAFISKMINKLISEEDPYFNDKHEIIQKLNLTVDDLKVPFKHEALELFDFDENQLKEHIAEWKKYESSICKLINFNRDFKENKEQNKCIIENSDKDKFRSIYLVLRTKRDIELNYSIKTDLIETARLGDEHSKAAAERAFMEIDFQSIKSQEVKEIVKNLVYVAFSFNYKSSQSNISDRLFKKAVITNKLLPDVAKNTAKSLVKDLMGFIAASEFRKFTKPSVNVSNPVVLLNNEKNNSNSSSEIEDCEDAPSVPLNQYEIYKACQVLISALTLATHESGIAPFFIKESDLIGIKGYISQLENVIDLLKNDEYLILTSSGIDNAQRNAWLEIQMRQRDERFNNILQEDEVNFENIQQDIIVDLDLLLADLSRFARFFMI